MTYVPPRRSDGSIQHAREQMAWPADRPFRILTIDGGGIRGILPASILAELETRFLGGRSIADRFDMIAGTSTGGIIALSLAHDLTAQEIRRFYVERGGLIFPPAGPLGRIFRNARRIGRYKYDSERLEEELLGIFGDTPLGDAKVRLCIPSFEGTHGEPWIYKTPHHPDYRKDRVERMVRVAMATSAAPTYFKALPNNGYTMVDGGLWANNPVMNAVVDALACFDVSRSQIRVLSLGCGETTFKIDAASAEGGMWQWRNAIGAAMRAQSLNALGQSYLLLGRDNVVRLDGPESASPIALDNHERASTELPAMARAVVDGAGHHVENLFLREAAATYVPCPVTS